MPNHKKDRIIEHIDTILLANSKGDYIPAKTLATTLGQINSGFKALGPLSRILMRSSYKLLSQEVQPFDIVSGKFLIHNWSFSFSVFNQVAG